MLPEIELNNDKLYAVLKIGFMVAAFTVITFNVLAAHATIMNGTEGAEGVACPPNTMLPPDGHCGEIIITQNATLIILEQNGSSGYPDNYYNDTNGIPNELIDDDLEEEDEEQDEKQHEEESKQK